MSENYRSSWTCPPRAKPTCFSARSTQDQTRRLTTPRCSSPNGGENIQVYRKLHLVPFGEYVPGRNTVPFVARIVGDQVPADFARGKEPVVFRLTTDKVQVAPLICFEDTLGELTRQFVLRGANLLANVTNDGWFLHSAGSRQHLDNAIFRCVETRRPMVRAANTGVTCFVNRIRPRHPSPARREREPVHRRRAERRVEVPTDGRLTFYVRHGELFAKICGACALLFLVVFLVRPQTGCAERASPVRE